MANTKNAKKADRQSKKRRVENRYVAKSTRSAIKDIRVSENKADATKELPKVMSMIDKLAKKKVIHPNKAANLKSGLVKKVAALK